MPDDNLPVVVKNPLPQLLHKKFGDFIMSHNFSHLRWERTVICHTATRPLRETSSCDFWGANYQCFHFLWALIKPFNSALVKWEWKKHWRNTPGLNLTVVLPTLFHNLISHVSHRAGCDTSFAFCKREISDIETISSEFKPSKILYFFSFFFCCPEQRIN